MTVSIVVPCYNQERFVREALESALAQSHAPLEIIVVNDGSTDRSGAVIGTVASSHDSVRIIEQPNRGLSAARNTGLDAASGDIVIFLDADDRLRPDAVRAAVDSFAAHPAAGMTFGRCQLIDEDGAPMVTSLPLVEHDFYAELLRRNYIWTPAMAAFRRQVFATIGTFDPSVNASADYDVYLRLAREVPLAAHNSVVADYRQHGSSMSRDPVAMLDATLAVLRSQRPYVATRPQLAGAYRDGVRAWRGFYGERLVERFRTHLHSGRYALATRDAWHLLRLYPRGVWFHLTKKLGLIMRAPGQSMRSSRLP